jgi:hypothetical protein
MSGAYSTHVGDEKCVTQFLLESLKGRDNTEYLGVGKGMDLREIGLGV